MKLSNKYFQLDVMTTVQIPYEEGVMSNGKVNKNHLMYVAQAILDKNPDKLKSYYMSYKNHRLIEMFDKTEDEPGPGFIETKL